MDLLYEANMCHIRPRYQAVKKDIFLNVDSSGAREQRTFPPGEDKCV